MSSSSLNARATTACRYEIYLAEESSTGCYRLRIRRAVPYCAPGALSGTDIAVNLLLESGLRCGPYKTGTELTDGPNSMDNVSVYVKSLSSVE